MKQSQRLPIVVNVLVLLLLRCEAQIPAACADDSSLMNRRCCPVYRDTNNTGYGVCGELADRGTCGSIADPPSEHNRDIRNNWPHYFTEVCICNGNYGGYDCSGCKYGYYGPQCQNYEIVARRSLQKFSKREWRHYLDILHMAKYETSRYNVILNDTYQPGDSPRGLEMRDITIYDLFVWFHHYASKDSDSIPTVDYAHSRTGFPTWHRQLLLWFESEIQHMLKKNGTQDYHRFRTSYWDWTDRDQRISYFDRERLGQATYDSVDTDLPTGLNWDLYGAQQQQWNTICWQNTGKVSFKPCDPSIKTNVLLRCARNNQTDPCSDADYKYWPKRDDWKDVVKIENYDTSPYNACASDSFRSLMEGYIPHNESCEEEDLMCLNVEHPLEEGCTAKTRQLHNAVHLIVGTIYTQGVNKSGPYFVPTDKRGTMAEVQASANDPIFINHHTMIDCIFEEWLNQHPNAKYPSSDNIPKGHRFNDHIVPFFPAFTHADMFKSASHFGYSCSLSDPVGGDNHGKSLVFVVAVVVIAIIIIVACVCACVCFYSCDSSCKDNLKYRILDKDL